LESTGDFSVSVAILGAVLAAGTITRLRFGYSFATWRFHLRGLPLRGAYDIGWVKELTVGRLMRRDPKVVRREESLSALQAAVVPGSAARLFAVDAEGRFVGAFDAALLRDPDIADGAATIVAADLASGRDSFLVPTDDIQAALKKFDTLLVEVLPVVSDSTERRVVGYLTEALALRRYTEELERRRSEDLGVPGAAR
jgi:CIC family chloride channel protein